MGNYPQCVYSMCVHMVCVWVGVSANLQCMHMVGIDHVFVRLKEHCVPAAYL